MLLICIDGCGGLDSCKGAREIVTGSRDGHVKVFDPRTNDPVADLQPANQNQKRDCWTVCFGNAHDANNRFICAGYDNGDVKMFDLRINKIYWETNVRNGVVSLQFDRKDIKINKLLCTTLESQYRVYDLLKKHKIDGFSYLTQNAHKSTIWKGVHLPQNRDVWCTCGGDGTINLWKYIYPNERFIKDAKGNEKGVMGEIELIAEEKIATQPIVGWDWHKDKIGLACCTSLDQKVKVIIVTKLAKL